MFRMALPGDAVAAKTRKEAATPNRRGQYAADEGPIEALYAPSEVMLDRDPDTGRRFPTVMAMRERKLRDWVDATAQGRGGAAARVRNAAHVACRDFMMDER